MWVFCMTGYYMSVSHGQSLDMFSHSCYYWIALTAQFECACTHEKARWTHLDMVDLCLKTLISGAGRESATGPSSSNTWTHTDTCHKRNIPPLFLDLLSCLWNISLPALPHPFLFSWFFILAPVVKLGLLFDLCGMCRLSCRLLLSLVSSQGQLGRIINCISTMVCHLSRLRQSDNCKDMFNQSSGRQGQWETYWNFT